LYRRAKPYTLRPLPIGYNGPTAAAAPLVRDHVQGWRRVTVRADIVPGAVFPDYELKHHTGQRVRLSTLQGNDPMVLILTRGNF
jgi:hypothetical protein